MKARFYVTLLFAAVGIVAPFVFANASEIDITQTNDTQWNGYGVCNTGGGNEPMVFSMPIPSDFSQLLFLNNLRIGTQNGTGGGNNFRLYATTTPSTDPDIAPTFDDSWLAAFELANTRGSGIQAGLTPLGANPTTAYDGTSSFAFTFSNFQNTVTTGTLYFEIWSDCNGGQGDPIFLRSGGFLGAYTKSYGNSTSTDVFPYVNTLTYETTSATAFTVISPTFLSTTELGYSSSTVNTYCSQYYSASSTGWLDATGNALMKAMCWLAYDLFVPSPSAISRLTSAQAGLAERIPFGYFASVSSTFSDVIDATGTTGNLDITVPMAAGTNFATPTIRIIDLENVRNNAQVMSVFDIIKNAFRIVIGLALFVFIVYEIISHRAMKD